MERQPVKTIPIHEHLRPKLCDTYENDSIFDKFEVVFSGDAKNVMTGSYNNNFMIYPSDPDKEVEVVLQADKSAFKAKKVGIATPINSSTTPIANGGRKNGSRAGSPAGSAQRMKRETDANQIDFNKKILHMSWHPFEDSIAIAATNNVCHFTAKEYRTQLLTHVTSYLFFQPCERGDGPVVFFKVALSGSWPDKGLGKPVQPIEANDFTTWMALFFDAQMPRSQSATIAEALQDACHRSDIEKSHRLAEARMPATL